VVDVDDSECLVCREQRGDVVLPGGFLINDESVVAFHCPPLPGVERPYLGYLFVTSRRHVPSFAELEPDEAAAIGAAMGVLSAALKSEGAERVYVLTIGHAWPHLHVHLIPRWPETPAEVSWMNVDDWEGARRGDARDVEAMTLQLRTRITAD
jgi:diadenosine tetraphosphate (Ap4A) HIT family hydrolase